MNILTELTNFLLDLIFPKNCFFCSKFGSYICKDCEQKRFLHFKKRKCHVCHGELRSSTQFIHNICRKNTHLDGVFTSYILNNDLKKLIYAIKYKFESEVLVDLGPFYKLTIGNIPIKYDLISFVPLDKYRRNWRDFNQAEIIAKKISWKALPILTKTKKTIQQAKLNKKERHKNLSGSIKVISPNLVKGKTILLCDDVYTTGSTLELCASILKSAGAKRVYAFTLAIDELPADIPSQIE